MKTVIKCMAKDCLVKIIIQVKKIIIDEKEQLEPKEMLNLCPRHKNQFDEKLTEIKKHFTKSELKTKIATDIATNVAQVFKEKNKTPN